MDDPIVEEVRRIRDEHAAQYHYDPQLIYQALKAQENAYQGKKVTLAPKPAVVIQAKPLKAIPASV
ncbi:MAG: hypothetical protein ACKO4U_19425 [Caldilinea sp.]|jgi:hypothetical protein